MDHDLEKAKNMKLLLCVFEQLSGLKINFHKSDIFCYGEAKHYEQEYTRLFGCGIGSFPFRYLGIPTNNRKLHNAYWIIRGKIQMQIKHLESQTLILWLVLLNSVLSSFPMFMMSFLKFLRMSLRNRITIGLDSFGKAIMRNKNIILPSGTSYVVLKIKEV
jgi:hypothetical protein